METKNIAQKIWSFCDTLRDDGLGYNDYLEQLTYLLFLKMADENKSKYNLPVICDWQRMLANKGGELLDQYEKVLKTLGKTDEISIFKTILSAKFFGTKPWAMAIAKPSAIAVLPIPALPKIIILFFLRRDKT